MARPGIMLYFDIRQPLKVLPDADKGRLLDAILEYGEHGTVPEFDGMLALAWGFIQPKLDRDEESYENAKVQRRYAAFCKRRANANLPKIPFDEWLNMDNDERKRAATEHNEPLRAVDFVNGRYPTTTASASASANTTASVTAAAAVTAKDHDSLAAAAADKKLRILNGELGQGVIFLTNAQLEDLLSRLDLEVFDYYVSKLAKFIIKNGADVKNHYETILKWWKEDSEVKYDG